jgi:hypothetical protein
LTLPKPLPADAAGAGSGAAQEAEEDEARGVKKLEEGVCMGSQRFDAHCVVQCACEVS